MVDNPEFCASCGRALDVHDRNTRFRLPDALLRLREEDWKPTAWGSPDRDMLEVPGIGSFIRSLLQVHLSGGFSVTFGLWLEVSPGDLRRAYDLWGDEQYASFLLQGVGANSIPPWEAQVLGKDVTAAVADPTVLPVVVESSDPIVRGIIEEEWPHEEILAALKV
jgi:hypothetical protein